MGFKLPRLTREVDSAPLGYPGLVLVFWLNPPDEDWQPPKAPVMDGKPDPKWKANPWDKWGYRMLSRMLEAVVIPGEYTDDGEDVTIPIENQKDAWELEQTDGFDPALMVWAVEAWRQSRAEWLQAEVKN